MANKIQSLLPAAAAVRDATNEGENTAMRVGSLFVSVLNTLLDTIPSEVINASGITLTSDNTYHIITLPTLKADGTSGTKQVKIPKISDSQSTINNELRNWIETLDRSVGEPDGIAPLDESGLLPRECLPEGCGGLALYDGNVDGNITVSAQTYAGEASPTILFSTHHKRFVAKFTAGTAPILITTYYANWAGADRLGAAATDGRTPETDRLYLNTANRTLHYWTGTAMAQPDGVTNEIWDTLDAMMASLKSLERTAGYSGQLNLNVYLAYKPDATRQVTQPFAGLAQACAAVPANMRYTGLALTFLESQAGGSPQWRTCRFVGTIPIINNAPDYTEWTNANYWTDL